MENTNDKVSLINQNIMEISAAMEETGANIDSQTTSIQNIDKTCKDTTHAVDVLVSHAEEMSDKAKEIGERVNEAVQKLMTDKDSAVEIVCKWRFSRQELLARLQLSQRQL